MATRSPTFTETLGVLEDGRVEDQLSDALVNLVRELQTADELGARAPKGKLTLTLDVALVEGIVEVRADVRTSHPKQPRVRSIFWPLEHGGLSPQNPKQLRLPLGESKADLTSPQIRKVT